MRRVPRIRFGAYARRSVDTSDMLRLQAEQYGLFLAVVQILAEPFDFVSRLWGFGFPSSSRRNDRRDLGSPAWLLDAEQNIDEG